MSLLDCSKQYISISISQCLLSSSMQDCAIQHVYAVSKVEFITSIACNISIIFNCIYTFLFIYTNKPGIQLMWKCMQLDQIMRNILMQSLHFLYFPLTLICLKYSLHKQCTSYLNMVNGSPAGILCMFNSHTPFSNMQKSF